MGPLVSFREEGEEQILSIILKQLEEKWYSVPVESIQNLHESVPRRIQAMLQANVGPTPY